MSKTKLKILETALRLFNQKGLSDTSLRTIANEMGISQGNISYHYKKREEIIEQLYFQLVENIDNSIESIDFSEVSLDSIFTIFNTITDQFYEFRFFLLDFSQIMRTHETIRDHYQQLMIIRKTQMLFLWNLIISKDFIRPESFKNEYENLYTRIQIMTDFWMSSYSLKGKKITKKTTQQYTNIIFESIYPYLTEKGIIEYQKIQS